MASQLVRINGALVNARWTPAPTTPQTVTVPYDVIITPTLYAPSVATPPGPTEMTVNSPSGYKGRASTGLPSGTVTTGTISPNAETLILVFAAAANAAGLGQPVDEPGTMTGLGLTWTKVANLQYASRRKLYCWWAYAESIPTPGTLSIPYAAGGGAIQDVGWVVVEVGGADSTGPIGTVSTTQASGATSITGTLSGTPEDGDRVFAAAGIESSAAVTAELDLINETGYTSGDNFRQLVVQWDDDSVLDTSPTFSWTPADSAGVVAFYVNAGGVRPRTVAPAVVSTTSTVYTPSVALANSPQSVAPAVVTNPPQVHAAVVTNAGLTGERPTYYNTGPSGTLTDLNVGDIGENGGTFTNRRIVGGNWFAGRDGGVSWGNGVEADSQVYTFTNCEFTEELFLSWDGPSQRNVYSSNLPTVNLTDCSGRGLNVGSPVYLNVERYRGWGDGRAMSFVCQNAVDPSYDWIHQFFPIDIKNSYFYQHKVVDHTEVWWCSGQPDGVRFENCAFNQRGNAAKGITGVTNVHFGPGTLGGDRGESWVKHCWFDYVVGFGDDTPASATAFWCITANRGQMHWEDCYLVGASRSCGYFTGNGDDLSDFTMSGMRDLDSGNLLVWDGTSLSDSGSP